MGTAEGCGKGYVPGIGHDRLLPLYDPLHMLLGMALLHRPLADQAGIWLDHRVLEIGCGTGNLALLAKRLHPDAEVARPAGARPRGSIPFEKGIEWWIRN